MADTFYHNKSSCKFQKITDEVKDWCLSDKFACINPFDDFDRIYTESFDLITAFYDLASLFFFDLDFCISDIQAVSAYQRLVEDLSLLKRSLFGFNYEWDQERQVKHVSRAEFRKVIAEYAGKKTLNPVITDYLF